jgi:hypothetical protein
MTLLIVVLLAGGVMGWVAHQLSTPSQEPAARGVDALMSRYTRELNLDAGQQDSVRSILVRRQRETRLIWQDVHPRYESVRSRAKSEIEAQLRPDQKTLFEQLIFEEDRERAERQKDRGMIDTDTTQVQRQ